MFERFTQRARRVVVLAQEEAGRFGHNYIVTEHLLLGLVREEDGVAARALASLNVALDEVREQVESVVGFGEGGGRSQVPFTSRSEKVLELALRESMQLGHNYIGTEHILLGLVRESEGVAARVLSNLDVNPDEVRRQILLMLGEEPESDPLDQVEGTGERGTAGNLMLFRGRVGALEVGARVGGLNLTLLVDLDYAYAVRDTDRSSETRTTGGFSTASWVFSKAAISGRWRRGSRRRAGPRWSTSPRSGRSRSAPPGSTRSKGVRLWPSL